LAIINKAQYEETRETAFRIYLARLPYFDTPKSFEEFWEDVHPKIDETPIDDAMQDILNIEKQIAEKGDATSNGTF